ncbi:MurT ligase domain-containing protein [Saccharopolyspora flava]|uniref:Lipid II isoglutaminyl synthase (glutamine-hydrolyzing) subunit MurT n=1 Tax=Saccharopolyspora flava TaxID=95161 RepID=A0A1I6SXV2_9PSEU|nr:MurT ligase domain-containing protein [Saccharopolyspora flava]SFS81795.1 UDP-N-acetylmuramyl tripeptide synthase [Saccharopolyspora flava]
MTDTTRETDEPSVDQTPAQRRAPEQPPRTGRHRPPDQRQDPEQSSPEQSGTDQTGVDQHWKVVPAPERHPERTRRRDLRTNLAINAGRMAASLSQRLGLGSGGMIGGRLAMTLQPDLLQRLAAGRRVVMVTGTNGKTTTTQMVAEALRAQAPAVSNATGANMLDGHVAALLTRLDAPFAALEVDELHLAQVTERFEPAAILLLNLSRDQLDRVGEVRTVAASLQRALAQVPDAQVIANRDDPNIVFAAIDHPHVTWVSGGVRWRDDALNCPRCGAFIGDVDRDWRCECGLARPPADWKVTDTGVLDAEGTHHELALALPGHVNRVNATFALAAALELGGEEAPALARIRRISQAAGRYDTVRVGGRKVRLLLAKNPASWLEMLDLVSGNDEPLVLVVNSREADGYDVSWLWDVDFEMLRGRPVQVAGDRALDLAVRLRYAQVPATVASTVEVALGGTDGGVPDVIANYTAFRDVLTRSRR